MDQAEKDEANVIRGARASTVEVPPGGIIDSLVLSSLVSYAMALSTLEIAKTLLAPEMAKGKRPGVVLPVQAMGTRKRVLTKKRGARVVARC